MAKAILVLDEMPENCRECQFEDQDDSRRKNICNATAGDRAINDFEDEVDEDERPDWCPLKELPEKVNEDGKDFKQGSFWYRVSLGWNACIDAIEEKEG